MSEFWQQLLMQVVISFVSGLVGGGLISAYLDWRRFQREKAQIEKEERRVAVDSIRSVIDARPWHPPTSRMSDKLQLYIYKNGLQDSIREYAIVAEFVIRNLTDEEVIITRIEVDEPGLPPLVDWDIAASNDTHLTYYDSSDSLCVTPKDTGFIVYDMQAFYDWRTKKEKERTEADFATLESKGTLPLAYIAVRRFYALRRLDEPPTSIAVIVHSTGGHKLAEVLELTEGRLVRALNRVDKYSAPKDSVEWSLAEKKKKEEEEAEEEIPF